MLVTTVKTQQMLTFLIRTKMVLEMYVTTV